MPDYRIRQAKHVERMMIVDVLRKLDYLHPIADYSYVGFGAQYFVDFSLLHRTLGISKMVSLEYKTALVPRCEFNKPFDWVDVRGGASWEHFGEMDFAEPTIVWADYVGPIQAGVLGDLDTLALRLPPGSVLIATVEAEPDGVALPPHGRLELLEKRVGADTIPHGTTNAHLGGWDNAAVISRIVDNQIRSTVANRVPTLDYEQLFNFHYRDSVRMITVGGVIVDDTLRERFDAVPWAVLDGYRAGDEALRIELPHLTIRELAHLDNQLPNGIDTLASPGLTDEDIKWYGAFYRYYPRYALVDVQ